MSEGSGRGRWVVTLLVAAGATAVGYCAPAMGLVRIVRAGRRLASAGSGLALATGSSVVAAQSQAAVVLGIPGR